MHVSRDWMWRIRKTGPHGWRKDKLLNLRRGRTRYPHQPRLPLCICSSTDALVLGAGRRLVGRWVTGGMEGQRPGGSSGRRHLLFCGSAPREITSVPLAPCCRGRYPLHRTATVARSTPEELVRVKGLPRFWVPEISDQLQVFVSSIGQVKIWIKYKNKINISLLLYKSNKQAINKSN